jgi:glucosamine-6-phosphate deaminase
MNLLICDDREAAGEKLAEMLATEIADNPRIRLGLATGRTSQFAYVELVRRFHDTGGFSFRHVTAFSTDEFVGLAPEDHRSTRYVLNYHLFRQVDIPREQTFVPLGTALDMEAECEAFDALLKARGGLDLVVLGLGYNGHVGLNEPGSTLKSRTRIVDLTPSTLAAVSGGERFKNLQETPAKAISMGMASIFEAKRVLLTAVGLGKADIVHRIVRGRAGPSVPATLLLPHPNLTMIIDQDAASRIGQSETQVPTV